MKYRLLTPVLLAAIVVCGLPRTAWPAPTSVASILGSGTFLQLFVNADTIPAGAIFDSPIAELFNADVVAFDTFIPSFNINHIGTAIPDGIQYAVEVRDVQSPNKVVRGLPGGGSATFALHDMSATVLDASRSTITFTAREELVAQSGSDWDFSPFANPGSTLSIVFTFDPTRGVDLQKLLANDPLDPALDPQGNRIFLVGGAYQFNQQAGTVPEPSTLVLAVVGVLAVITLGLRQRKQ